MGPGDVQDLFERAAQGCFDGPVLEWLARGFAVCARSIESGQALPLERCLRLPPAVRRKRNKRNSLILALEVDLGLQFNKESTQRAIAVHRAIEVFATRGAWHVWRDLAVAPATATPVECRLFQILQISGGRVLCLKQIDRVMRPD